MYIEVYADQEDTHEWPWSKYNFGHLLNYRIYRIFLEDL